MYFIIYKTTNLINGKFYIGKHQTNNLDDGYVGSGKLLQRAIKKYGKDNFVTEIIDVYDYEWQMNLAEKIYVVIDKEVSYNLCSGGKGGFGYINKNGLNLCGVKVGAKKSGERFLKRIKEDECFRLQNKIHLNEIQKKGHLGLRKKYPNGIWFNKKHSKESKRKIGEKNKSMTGTNNSQYGTCWITNGQENKKIKKEDIDNWLPKGYSKGRCN